MVGRQHSGSAAQATPLAAASSLHSMLTPDLRICRLVGGRRDCGFAANKRRSGKGPNGSLVSGCRLEAMSGTTASHHQNHAVPDHRLQLGPGSGYQPSLPARLPEMPSRGSGAHRGANVTLITICPVGGMAALDSAEYAIRVAPKNRSEQQKEERTLKTIFAGL